MKVNKRAINQAIEATKDEITDIQYGIERENTNSLVGKIKGRTNRLGVQQWLTNNRRLIDLGLIVALYGTGNPVLASLLAVLFIVDTM
jgi:hypothetical protein